ncbi:alpha/beta fold hydrolase [Dactylosporangium sp. CA-139066]|uniref:alpha/beta fold hydrolase n=1 Tax=Dactylosporangium sp. CA-139066 TaxID=3239930 RepID=UPI003D8EAEF4
MTTVRRPTEVCALESGPIEYRLERRGDDVLLIMHGGHMRAGLALGEDSFAAGGFTVLAPSRPGYGRTRLQAGPTPAHFADAVAELCAALGITCVTAVVGISGGAPTAVTMAARHPGLVQRLVLISPVGFLPWPDLRTRLGSYVAFRPGIEVVTWTGMRLFLRAAPVAALRMVLAGVSNHPTAAVADLQDDDRATLLALFSAMRSGRGFLNDLQPTPNVTARVTQPTLVIATRADGGVPFAHAESLAAGIHGAELVESHARSHLVWFAPDWPALAAVITAFLKAPTAGPGHARASSDAPVQPPTPSLVHQPLRAAVAALALAGAVLAASTAGPAFTRLGTAAGVTFLSVAAALTALAAGVLRRAVWATRLSLLGLAGQPIVAAGALWQVSAGMPAGKAAELHQLGVAPVIGAWINLGYGLIGATLFGWLLTRWWRVRAAHRDGRS